jgi:hypothetical protein
MTIIRAFRADDLDAVARLHESVFPLDSGPAPLDDYRHYLRATFLVGPRSDSDFTSIVSEESDGALSGFLGVVPVKMVFKERPIWATVCTQFCVDPRRRGMTGLKLIRHHLSGRQELSITDEANAKTMRLWSWAGGEAVTSCSLHFVRPLRPARFALAYVSRRPALARLARRMRFSARVIDAVLARMPRIPVRPPPPSTRGESLDALTMAHALAEITRERTVRPAYEPDVLRWYLARAAAPDGDISRVLVRDANGKLLGWYIYRCEDDGTARLLQLAAGPAGARDVLDHLLHDAWRSGALALGGRLDPALAQACSDRHCLFSRRGPWMVVHARDAALRHAFHRGDALFSSLDGEYCVRFKPPAN